MTHDELLAKLLEYDNSCNTAGSDKDVPKSYNWDCYELHSMAKALHAVAELHKPESNRMPFCVACRGVWQGEIDVVLYPCPTIQAIEKELK